MSSLGSLVVSLSANTAQFSSDMGKAAHEAAKRMEDMKKAAAAAGAAIGASFVAGAGTAAILVQQAIESADAMGKMAQKAGMSVEAFSELAYAAKMSDVEAAALSTSLAKLGGKINDVAAGAGGEAAAAFQAMGIEVKNADGSLKDSGQVMTEVAQKFSQYQDGAAKSALAIKIFGEEGTKLVPLLNSGASGLAEMRAEAAELGAVLDGPTKAAAENFNDNLSRLNTLKEGFANQIMKAVLPSLEGMTNRMIESAKGADGLAKAATVAATGVKILMTAGSLVTAVFKSVGEYIGGVAATLVRFFSGDWKGAFEIAKSVVSDFRGNMVSAAENVSAIWNDAAKTGESGAEKTGGGIAAPIVKAAQKSQAAGKVIAAEAKKVDDTVQRMIDGLALQADTFGKSAKEADLWKAMLAGATDSQLEFIAAIHDGIDVKQKDLDLQTYARTAYENSLTPLQKYSAELEKLNEVYQKGFLDPEAYAAAVAKAQNDFDNLGKKGGDTFEDLKRSVEGWGRNFTDEMARVVETGKLDFGKLADAIIGDLLRISIQKTITDKLIGGFATDKNAGTGILGFIGGFFGGGKALGGEVSAGTSYLVGEKGPEIFTPATSGAIIPNGAVSGGGFNQVLNIRIDGTTDMATNQRMIRSAVQQGNAELVERLQRSGRL